MPVLECAVRPSADPRRQFVAKNNFHTSIGGRRQAFTLIELSIVLVVIGLIVGGVMVGRNLIYVANVRKTVAQVEQFNTAVNAFKSKYNCLPGDCINASNFAFNPSSNGNGDGVVGWCTSNQICYQSTNGNSSEYVNFWYHLSASGSIPYSLQSAAPNPITGINTPAPILHASACTHAGWTVKSDMQFQNTTSGTGMVEHNFLLSDHVLPFSNPVEEGGCYAPADMRALDAKMDDGFPLSGMVRAWSRVLSGVGGAPVYQTKNGDVHPQDVLGDDPGNPPGCVSQDTTAYNAQYTGAERGALCNLAIKAAF